MAPINAVIPLDFGSAPSDPIAVFADARLDNHDSLCRELDLRVASPIASLITAAYQRWDTNFAHHLIGDFAVAVVDRQHRCVLLARDPMAMRPLYTRVEPSRRVILGSRIRQILAVADVPDEIDEQQLAAFLHGPYGIREKSFHRGIDQVAPGTTMLIGSEGAARCVATWTPDLGRRTVRVDPQEYQEELRELLLQAARSRLEATGPGAILLSGGVDSGAATLATGRLTVEEGLPAPHTYGWGFEELPTGDETATAQRVAAHYQLPFDRILGDDAYPLADHPRTGPALESPATWPWDPLVNRSYRRIADDGARVLMTGARGDEVIGDAVWDFAGLARARRFRGIADRLHGRGLSGTRGLIRSETGRPTTLAGPTLGRELRGKVDIAEIRAGEAALAPEGYDRGRRHRYRRIFGYAAHQLSALDARQISAHGMTLVDPWTDRRIIEWILSIPQYEITRPDRPKQLVRDTIRPWAPAGLEFIAEDAPLLALRNRGLHDRRRAVIDELVENSHLVARGYLEREYLTSLWTDEKGGAPNVLFEWALAAELWLRHHWADDGGPR